MSRTFDEYSTACAQAEYTIQINNKSKRKNWKTSLAKTTATEAKNKPVGKDMIPTQSNMSPEVREQLMKDRKCF
jgi:hypothetical protein